MNNIENHNRSKQERDEFILSNEMKVCDDAKALEEMRNLYQALLNSLKALNAYAPIKHEDAISDSMKKTVSDLMVNFQQLCKIAKS